ncbi:MAG: hypothetical protein R2857_10140 [Vampirovibrionales bacterium]
MAISPTSLMFKLNYIASNSDLELQDGLDKMLQKQVMRSTTIRNFGLASQDTNDIVNSLIGDQFGLT